MQNAVSDFSRATTDARERLSKSDAKRVTAVDFANACIEGVREFGTVLGHPVARLSDEPPSASVKVEAIHKKQTDFLPIDVVFDGGAALLSKQHPEWQRTATDFLAKDVVMELKRRGCNIIKDIGCAVPL